MLSFSRVGCSRESILRLEPRKHVKMRPSLLPSRIFLAGMHAVFWDGLDGSCIMFYVLNCKASTRITSHVNILTLSCPLQTINSSISGHDRQGLCWTATCDIAGSLSLKIGNTTVACPSGREVMLDGSRPCKSME